MKSWLVWSACVALLALNGCSGGSSGSSADPNLQRCKGSCTQLCAMETCSSSCSMDDCMTICLGATAGLEPACAQCVATNPGHLGGLGSACQPVFKSTGSPDCAPVCAGQGGDAAVD